MIAVKRNRTLAWMQVIGCILVIFGHSYPFITEYPSILHSIKVFIYQFHMPLFVFCSGVLLVLSNAVEKYSFSAYLRRRAMRLLVPYFVLSVIGIVPKILFSSVLNDSLHFDLFELFRAFFSPRNNIWGHFWFLPMIFLLGVFGYLLLRASKKMWVRYLALVISFCALFLPNLTDWLGVNDLLGNAAYFVLGMCVSDFFTEKKEIPVRKECQIGVAALVAAVAIFLCPDYFPAIKTLKGAVIAFLMISATCFLLMPFARRYDSNAHPILNRTFSIFILSWPCQLAVEVLTERVLHLDYYIIMPCMLLSGIFIPCVLILLVDHIEKNHKYKPITRVIGG